jgi:hypothetical protein
MTTKKLPEELRYNKFLNRAYREVTGFAELLQHFESNIFILGRSSAHLTIKAGILLPWQHTRGE